MQTKNPAAYYSIATTMLALVVAFGVKLSVEQSAALLGVVEAGLFFWFGRSPKAAPTTPPKDPDAGA